MSLQTSPAASDLAIGTTVNDDSDRYHGASLRSKLVLSLAGMFFVFLMIDELVRQRFLRPAFGSLERTYAINDASRVLSAIVSEKQHLGTLASQFAAQVSASRSNSSASDDAATPNAAGMWQSDLIVSPSIAASVSSVHRVDATGRWSTYHSNIGDQPDPDSVAELLNGDRVSQWRERLKDGVYTDLIRDSSGTLHIVAAEVLNRDAEGQPADMLIVRRRMDLGFMEALRLQSKVMFSLQDPIKVSQPSHHGRVRIWEADAATLVVEFPLRDFDNACIANVFVQLRRDVIAAAYKATGLARNQFVFGSVAALLLLLLLLQRIVIKPLQDLRERTNRIADEGLHAGAIVVHSNDEIGKLGESFDHMVLRLRQSQVTLSKSSRAAGMSQVAGTVVHNIGNVLTNVNSLLETIEQKVTSLRIEPLGSLADRLRDPDMDLELMSQAPEYLHGLSQSLKSDRNDLVEMLSVLQGNVRHIHDVIREQRQHTQANTIRQSVVIGDLLQEAIRCCQERLRQCNVTVSLSGDVQSLLETDTSVLLQVLINIIANAQEAFDGANATDRHISITVKSLEYDLRIRVADNAAGMSDETLKRLFEAHYTTRATGTGLGLHFCSLSIARMGGRIEASSCGDGQGAEFTIWHPLTAAANADRDFNPNHSADTDQTLIGTS